MGITGNYIDDNFVSWWCTIALRGISSSHTAKYLADEISNILKEFKILLKASVSTVDGASNGKLAIDLIPQLDKLVCFTLYAY